MFKKLIHITFIGLASCASIPPQAPQLSEELGNQIASLEKSHITLLHAYFDERRDRVDEFINKVWVPEFTNTFFSNPQIQDAWDHIVQSQDTQERMEFFIAVGPQLQDVINEKRSELIKPLDELEQEIEKAIREEYNLARSANNTLTSFLTTASKIDENRQRYLKMLNISDDKISSIINQTDDVLNKLVATGEKVQTQADNLDEYKQKAVEYLQKMKELKDKVFK